MEKIKVSMVRAVKDKLYRAWFPSKEIMDKIFTTKRKK